MTQTSRDAEADRTNTLTHNGKSSATSSSTKYPAYHSHAVNFTHHAAADNTHRSHLPARIQFTVPDYPPPHATVNQKFP
jgi:hypothetical protein